MQNTLLKVLVDTREQKPYLFEKREVEIERVALPEGDYSLPGLEAEIAIERKSLDDLVSCLMGQNRDRFERELERLMSKVCKAVVIEASVDTVRIHRYVSRMSPHAVLQSIIAFQVRYMMPFVWAGSREGGEYYTYSLLDKFQRQVYDGDFGDIAPGECPPHSANSQERH